MATYAPPYAPVFLADKLGYFKQHGVTVTIAPQQGGSTAAAALIGGSAQFDAGVASDVMVADTKGNDLTCVTAINNAIFLDLVMNGSWAQSHGITSQSSAVDKLKALKGAKIGITAPGSLTDFTVRYMLSQAGLKPNVDYHEVDLGSPASNVAAMTRHAIDAAILNPSDALIAENTEHGVIAAQWSDFPKLQDAAFGCLIARQKYAQSHPEITRAVAASVAEANNYILQHPNQALALVAPLFKFPKAVLQATWAQYHFAPNGLSTQDSWDNRAQILAQNGELTPAQVGPASHDYTNAYLPGQS